MSDAFGSQSSNPHDLAGDGLGKIAVANLPEITSITLVDVREDGEWQAGHVDGAIHIPLAELPVRYGELDLDADLYVICRGGSRSERAVRYLETVGVEAVVVDGGMIAWAAAARPVVAQDGTPGQV